MSFSNPTNNIQQFDLQPGMKVAELGAGRGDYSIAAAKRVGMDGQVFAIEVQKDMLDHIAAAATAEHVNVQVVWGDIEHSGGTRLRDSSIDAVIVANVLFQIENQPGAVTEIQRILVPGGRVLVIDWTDSHGGMGPSADQVLTEDSAKALFKNYGFTYEKDIEAGSHHYGFIVTK